jgi:signal transduction histidine kinase
MNLRLRLTLSNVALLSLTLVLLGVLLRGIVARQALAELDRELTVRGQFVQQNFGRGGVPQTPPPGGMDGLPFLQIYDAQGRSRVHNSLAPDPTAIKQTLQTDQPRFTQTNTQRLYTVALHASQGSLAFQTGLPLSRVEQQVRAASQALLTLLPLALILVTGLSLFLTDRSLRPLEAAFDRQKRFTADASHELRTPLSIVKTAAELGRTNTGADEESRALFARIEKTADRTACLVTNLLQLARSDSGNLPVSCDTIDLPAFLTEVTDDARILFPGGARLEIGSCAATLYADPQLLSQLLHNLLTNALRHTTKEGTVIISATENTIMVADTGTGIAPEHLPHLTERFYRADTARTRKGGGTGLGLAICQAIVEAHSGKLTIESTLGRGTIVHVFLPQK